jgi:hypothetical protein
MWQEWIDKLGRKLHAFVDSALESSSVALYDQSLRDMEDYIRYVEEAAVGMKAAAESNRRHLARYQDEAEILGTRLDRLLAEDQEEQAQRVEQVLNVKRQQIADTEAQIERQEGQHLALAHNWQTLKQRLQVLRGERGTVEALVAVTRAEQAIGNIEHTLGGLASLGDDSEIGVMAGHILGRLDEAEARLALVDVDVEVARAVAAIEEARVEEQLLERRRRLGLGVEDVSDSPGTQVVEAQAPPEEGATVEETVAPEDEAAETEPIEPESAGPEVADEPSAPSEL